MSVNTEREAKVGNTIDGRKVRRLREERGWTQQELAYRAELDQGTVSRVEVGESQKIFVPTLAKLARVFGVPTDELLNGSKQSLAKPATEGHNEGAVAEQPLDLADPQLRLVLAKIGELPAEDQATILNVVQAFLARHRRQRTGD